MMARTKQTARLSTKTAGPPPPPPPPAPPDLPPGVNAKTGNNAFCLNLWMCGIQMYPLISFYSLGYVYLYLNDSFYS